MRRTNIYLSDEQLSSLQAMGEQRGVPMAELVRQAVDEWLRAQGVQVLGEDEWLRRFDALLSRRRRAVDTSRPSPTAIERDVARTVREVRRAGPAGRR
jgi:hypothetical protein